MTKPREIDITKMVWEAAIRVGRNAPKIADAVLAEHFPKTAESAVEEGASIFVRRGLIEHVTRLLKTANDDEGQSDLADIHPSFRSIVRDLKSKSYYVESLGEQVPLARLIAAPDLLNDARQFMRRKGDECLDEAARLDALYTAVIAEAA